MPHTTQKDGLASILKKSSLIYEKKKYSCKFFLNCKRKKFIGNNNKIISANNKNKSNLIIAVNKSHNSSATDIWQKIYFADKNLIQIKRGSSIKICLVAEGKANYYQDLDALVLGYCCWSCNSW